jgi:hypothetical protein
MCFMFSIGNFFWSPLEKRNNDSISSGQSNALPIFATSVFQIFFSIRSSHPIPCLLPLLPLLLISRLSLSGGCVGACVPFATLADAQAACVADGGCGGVVFTAGTV